jgi:TIR domain
MQHAASSANRTIAVLSQKYLESSFTAQEWPAAFAQDPQGRKKKLIPIRITPCDAKTSSRAREKKRLFPAKSLQKRFGGKRSQSSTIV